jgi:hypothetical protein
VSSPTVLILCSWKNTRSKGMSINTFRFQIYKISNCPFWASVFGEKQ